MPQQQSLSNKTLKSTRCPKCGGRLFVDTEIEERRLITFESCICCGYYKELEGRPLSPESVGASGRK